jgi:hypothetical protein
MINSKCQRCDINSVYRGGKCNCNFGYYDQNPSNIENTICRQCHPSCATCKGSLDSDCLTCIDPEAIFSAGKCVLPTPTAQEDFSTLHQAAKSAMSTVPSVKTKTSAQNVFQASVWRKLTSLARSTPFVQKFAVTVKDTSTNAMTETQETATVAILNATLKKDGPAAVELAQLHLSV